MINYLNLQLSKEVSSGSIEYISYTPALNEVVELYYFEGHAAYSVNCCVSVRWGTLDSNELIISTKGDTNESIYFSLIGDGTKSLFLFLENGEAGNVILSCKVDFISRT